MEKIYYMVENTNLTEEEQDIVYSIYEDFKEAWNKGIYEGWDGCSLDDEYFIEVFEKVDYTKSSIANDAYDALLKDCEEVNNYLKAFVGYSFCCEYIEDENFRKALYSDNSFEWSFN